MLNDDVPIWSVGDSWTYTVSSFTVDYDANGQRVYCTGRIDEVTLTVSSTSGTNYVVDVTGKITCGYSIHVRSSSLTLDMVGSLKPSTTKLVGSMVFSKSNLQPVDGTAVIKGISMAKILPLPFAVPLPIKISLDGDLSQPFPLFQFPLYTHKFWEMPDLRIQSNIKAGGIFGLIQIPVTFTTQYSWLPLAFHCVDKQSISVPAGTYTAWHITSTFFDMFDYYYAPAVGNLVKIDAVLPNGEVHAVLKSTTYSI
ncbi:MAG: hypothetical protein QXL17_01245 [Candidatus Thermoplasmatota archaeon]